MPEQANGQKLDLALIVTELAAAYVRHNHVSASDVPRLISTLRSAVVALAPQTFIAGPESTEQTKPKPTQVRRSITRDALISFIDGRPYKTLKRHLAANGLDAFSYRQKYDLPHDYPMVAPSYSEQRSELAKGRDFGRGSKGRPKKAK